MLCLKHFAQQETLKLVEADIVIVFPLSFSAINLDGFTALYTQSGEKIECGSQVCLSQLPSASLMVTNLSSVDGSLMAKSVLMEDHTVQVMAPLDKLKVSSIPLSRTDQQQSRVIFQQAFEKSLVLGKESFPFRKARRENQLSHLIKADVQTLLCGSSNRKVTFLGMYVPEVDMSLLGVHPSCRSITYSYKNKNIWDLDFFLGPKWDIFPKECGLRFITRITFRLGKEDMLSCISWAAVSSVISVDNYRKALQAEVYSTVM